MSYTLLFSFTYNSGFLLSAIFDYYIFISIVFASENTYSFEDVILYGVTFTALFIVGSVFGAILSVLRYIFFDKNLV